MTGPGKFLNQSGKTIDTSRVLLTFPGILLSTLDKPLNISGNSLTDPGKSPDFPGEFLSIPGDPPVRIGISLP